MNILPELFESNRSWAAEQLRNDPAFFDKLCAIHDPDLLWIGCSDSRVPANSIVGRAPGELFVHRNVANIVPLSDVNAMSVIDYAINALGVKHIIVCGHYRCGGIRAFLEDEHSGVAGLWLQNLRKVALEHELELAALEDPGDRWAFMCEANVKAQVRNLASSHLVQQAWARGASLSLHGWIYDLRDGLLRDLQVTQAGA
jgi:carbonic anhydrase